MVTLQQLVNNADFYKDILPILENRYEYYIRTEGVESYYQVFRRLQQMNGVKSAYQIYIDGNGNVSGYKIDEHGKEHFYDLDYLPWRYWLGMEIHFDTLLRYNDFEIIAHCLWEMTWISFEEEEIEMERMRQLIEDLDQQIDRMIPLENILLDNSPYTDQTIKSVKQFDVDDWLEKLLELDEEDED